MAKFPRDVPHDYRATAERKAGTRTDDDLSGLLWELALEKESDQHSNAYRLEEGKSGNHGREYQGPRPGQGTATRNARYMSNVQDLLWCDVRNEKGGLVHVPDCDQHECFVVQGMKQETETAVGGPRFPTTTGRYPRIP